MKVAELILAVATGLCGAGAAVCAVKDWQRGADVLSGTGLFLCSIWLLMRTL